MRLHPVVARIIAEAESRIAAKVLAPQPTHARGFYPFKNHPNLDIKFETCDTGIHPTLDSHAVNVQWAGEHPGSKIKGIYISCIHHNQGGRYTAMMLDYLASHGGRKINDFYFSFQGQLASGQTVQQAREALFGKLKNAFGLQNLEYPTEKANPGIYKAASIPTEVIPATEEPLPSFLNGKKELLPAAKVIMAAGGNFSAAESGAFIYLDNIPVDINHQKLILKALDDLKDGGILQHDEEYDKGKLSKVTIMMEGIDIDKKAAILEDMGTKKKTPPVYHVKRKKASDGEVIDEVVCEGLRFTIDLHKEDGSVCFVDGDGKRQLVGSYKKLSNASNIVREAVKRIKSVGITETVKMQWDKPINEEAR